MLQVLIFAKCLLQSTRNITDHADLIVIAVRDDSGDVLLNLRTGLDDTVAQKSIRCDRQGVCQIHNGVETDMCGARLNVAQMCRREPNRLGKLLLCHIRVDAGDLDPFANCLVIQLHRNIPP